MRARIGRSLVFLAWLLVVPLAVVSQVAAVEEADRFWLVGERAFQDGLHALSRRMLERFIERFPDDRRVPEATLLLGKARLAQGAFPAALESFRKAQALSPPPGKPEEARFWEGETLFRMKKYADARTAYDRIVSENAASPFAPDALYGLAWTQIELKQRAPAVASLRQLLEAFPGHQAIPSATIQLGRLLTELKRYDEAERVLGRFAERNLDHKLAPEARYLRGMALVAGGHQEEGLAELRAVATAYPSHEVAAQARRAVADSLVKGGRKTDLAQEYKSLMAQSPRTAEGLYDAGVMASRLGRPRDADQAWTLLRNEFPEHPLASRASLDLAQAAFARNSYKEAATLARSATKATDEPTRAQGFLLAGESDLRLKRYAPAHEAFQAAVEAAGSDAAVKFRALAGSGLAMEEQQQWTQAARYYDSVAAGSPDKELAQWAKTRRAAVAANMKGGGKSESKPSGKSEGKTGGGKPGGKSGSSPKRIKP